MRRVLSQRRNGSGPLGFPPQNDGLHLSIFWIFWILCLVGLEEHSHVRSLQCDPTLSIRGLLQKILQPVPEVLAQLGVHQQSTSQVVESVGNLNTESFCGSTNFAVLSSESIQKQRACGPTPLMSPHTIPKAVEPWRS